MATNRKLQKGEGWFPDELKFLLDNFHKLTNQELTDHINKYRSAAGQLSVSGVRHKCKGLSLTRSIQIRWSKKDIKRLKKWLPLMGNVEIARLLNEVGTSRRKINNQWVYRKFTVKNIEKKRKLLKLSRTSEQLARIKADNDLINGPECNRKAWEKRVKAQEQEIRIWKGQKVIKINGAFIPYTRWMYNNFIRKLEKHELVFHIDLDSLNDDPENLEIRTRKNQRVSLADRKRALPLLQNRLIKAQESFGTQLNSAENREKMKEIIRIQKLIETQEVRINKNIKSITHEESYTIPNR